MEQGVLDTAKVKHKLVLSDAGINQAQELRKADELRATLMEFLMDRSRTKDAAKKLIQRGLETGQTLEQIAARCLREIGRGSPSPSSR